MKRVFSLLLAAALMLSLAACGGGGTSSAGTSSNTAPAETAPAETASPGNSSDTTVYNLKLAHHDPANGAKGQFLQQLCDDITSESDGRIKFTVYPGATLCSAADAYESLTSGVCDMIWGAPGFESGTFEYAKFFSLMMVGLDDPCVGVHVIYDMLDNYQCFVDEYKDVHLVAAYTLPTYLLGFAKKEVKTADQMKGLQIRVSSGPVVQALQNWGAVPASVSAGDIYQNMEKNVLDGYLLEPSGIASFKLDEVTKFYLDIGLQSAQQYILMNKSVYESLPADLQAVIDAHSGVDGSVAMAEVVKKEANDWLAGVDSSKYYVATEAEKATFVAGAEAANQEYLATMNNDKYDAYEIYDHMVDATAKYNQEYGG